ncbi:hypothetical protein C7974DRAFT_155834 [Boeremia exigua]|uniref:uncharacterized protein n=1 Tax=Boeremia exigua TaxID=749465 RepID=UPI001E8D7FBF|nr:uncharacterized protein C7974DRAFT_92611 [Boeremia exigua]XP_045999404.1 uncharacterized protein C7974DRAFT_155834 [Boeremia exigua]KAH6611659.1 hypothetical protein C7974DRAFT_92611 [Boeremia exigua]KAH6638183.1 hypothetical protein C7974DRAFT_155834 [Boeremia exigua]
MSTSTPPTTPCPAPLSPIITYLALLLLFLATATLWTNHSAPTPSPAAVRPTTTTSTSISTSTSSLREAREARLEHRIAELERRGKGLGASNTELLLDNETLRARLEEAERGSAVLRAAGEGLKRAVGELKGVNGRWEDACGQLVAAYEELEAVHEGLGAAREELRTANADLQTANEELKTANEELKTTNASLSHQIHTQESAHTALRTAVRTLECDALASQLELYTAQRTHATQAAEQGARIADLESEKGDLAAANGELAAANDALEAAKDGLIIETTALRDQAEGLRRMHDILHTDYRRLSADTDALRARHERETAVLRDDAEELYARVCVLEREKALLEGGLCAGGEGEVVGAEGEEEGFEWDFGERVDANGLVRADRGLPGEQEEEDDENLGSETGERPERDEDLLSPEEEFVQV